MDENLETLRAFIAREVREGFDSAHDIAEDAQHFAYERLGRDDLQRQIKLMVADAVKAHQAEQSEWEPSTDCDRLDTAFAILNQLGIVARQNFSCCINCGFTEIWDEVVEEEKFRPVEGYVFYHLQCTERAIETGKLFMAYGSVEEDEEMLKQVTSTIIAELRRVGLDATWGGTLGHPIVVDGIVWRKRRSNLT